MRLDCFLIKSKNDLWGMILFTNFRFLNWWTLAHVEPFKTSRLRCFRPDPCQRSFGGAAGMDGIVICPVYFFPSFCPSNDMDFWIFLMDFWWFSDDFGWFLVLLPWTKICFFQGGSVASRRTWIPWRARPSASSGVAFVDGFLGRRSEKWVGETEKPEGVAGFIKPRIIISKWFIPSRARRDRCRCC